MSFIRLIGSTAAATIAFADLALSDTQIPSQFHGSWQAAIYNKMPTCLEIDADIRMTIRTNRIDLHEGRCTLQSVEVRDDTSLRLQAECWAEGDSWNSDEEWSLQTRGENTFLAITGLSADNPYKATYGLCEAGSAATNLYDAGETLCYGDELSSLALRDTGDGNAEIELEATLNRHICWIHGPVTKTASGYRYASTLDDGTDCALAIEMAADGSVSFKDTDHNCRTFHCGANAWFEDIEFTPDLRQQCE